MNFLELILSYPKASKDEIEKRIEELKKLGVEKIIEGGEAKLLGFNILGKGTNSLVVKAFYHGNEVALKIRRIDSSRESLKDEAEILKFLNPYCFAPKIFAYSKNFLVIELVQGYSIDEYLKSASIEDAKNVISKILQYCRVLDRLGIDHGQLSNAKDHVIVTKNRDVKIIDFESASKNRKVQNLTSIVSYLFFSKKVACDFFNLDFEKLKELIKEYKKSLDEGKFLEILKYLNLI